MEIYATLENLAKQKVRFFPLQPNSKVPMVKKFSINSEANATKALGWLKDGKNIAIATGQVAPNLWLVAIDVDDKLANNGVHRDGFSTLKALHEEGKTLSATWMQTTPAGGRHYLYFSHFPIHQGVDVLGVGVDTRCDGGYIVGPGSAIDGNFYRIVNPLLVLAGDTMEELSSHIAEIPDWIIQDHAKKKSSSKKLKTTKKINVKLATKRAIALIKSKTETGNDECFKTAAQVKDLGVPEEAAKELMVDNWPAAVEPEAIEAVVGHAYAYSKNDEGCESVENMFPDEVPKVALDESKAIVLNPMVQMNKDFFLVAEHSVARVCQETTDEHGHFYLKRLRVDAFKVLLANQFLPGKDGSLKPAGAEWLSAPGRRQYDKVIFDPRSIHNARFYNTWRGFPIPPACHPQHTKSVDLFLNHISENICGNDRKLFTWFISYFAHMFQKPGEKPRTAIVLKGGKGIGKSIIFKILGRLVGPYIGVLSNREQLFGRFNGLHEQKILLVLEEAFWSGSKSTEGDLKVMVTDDQSVTERKGEEAYMSKNYRRIVILGNEDWLVPASADERRYAVFEVGENRRGDQDYFGEMLKGFDKPGGYEALMHFFLNYKIDASINVAPRTKALVEQKKQSLNQFQEWYLERLQDGYIVDVNGSRDWHSRIETGSLQAAFQERHPRAERFTATKIGLELKKVIPEAKRLRVKKHGMLFWVYEFPSLSECRIAWDKRFNAEGLHEWPSQEYEEELEDLF